MAVVLFDIDGTLLNTGGAGSRSLDRAFRDLYGVADAGKAVSLAGRTDPAILRDLIESHSGGTATPAAIAQLLERYLDFLAEEVRDTARGRALPGVVELLDALENLPGVEVGLLTGNDERGARIKLGAWDLDRFAFGAFGSDDEDRNALVPFALRRLAQLRGAAIDTARAVIVIGDTTHDVDCARAHGARAIAVGTGFGPREPLLAAGPDLSVEDFVSGFAETVDFVRRYGSARPAWFVPRATAA